MRLLSARLKNLRAHKDTQIAFPSGVVGIVGDNESGKSTVLESLEWALYGGDVIRKTMKGLRWDGAPNRHIASATWIIEIGGVVHEIDRSETGATVTVNGMKEAEGTAAVNGYMAEKVGMSHKEFCASHLCPQKELAKMATMKPTERQTFVRKVMGHDRIDRALKALRAKKNALGEERRGIEAGLGERAPLEEAVARTDAERKAAVRTRVEAAADLDAAYEVHGNADNRFTASKERKAKHDEAERFREQGANAADQAGLEIARLERRAEEQKQAKARLAEAQEELAFIPGLREERDALVAAQASISERKMLEEREAALEEEIDGEAGLVERIADAEAQAGFYEAEAHEKAQAEAGRAGSALEELRKQRHERRARTLAGIEASEKEAKLHQRRIEAITGAGEDGDCPTCLRRLGDAYDVVMGTLQGALTDAVRRVGDGRIEWETEGFAVLDDEEVEAELARDEAERALEKHIQFQRDAEAGRQNAEILSAQCEAARTAFARITTRLKDMAAADFDAEALERVAAWITRLERLDTDLAGDRGLVANAAETQGEIASWTERRDRAIKGTLEAVEKIAATAFNAELHEKASSAHEEAAAALQEARVAAARAEEAERGAATQHENAKLHLDEYDSRATRLEKVKADHWLHERAAARLADFRVAIAATIRPELEELMSGLVHTLTDGRHEAVELTEDFEAVLMEGGVAREVVSGGTEDIAALAMRIALSQMIAERAGQPLSLLILDEPFGSLDEKRRGNVLSLIRRVKGVFPQVLVISHVAETRDAVDHVVELEYDSSAGHTRVTSAPLVEQAGAA